VSKEKALINTEKRYLKKIKAAHLIYKEHMRLQDVAKMLGVSRPTLAKLVEEILDEGIVDIQIRYPGNIRKNLEAACFVRQKYGLRDVIVVSASAGDSAEIFDSIGSAGADYFRDLLREDMVVGITGGKTIYSLVTHVTREPKVAGVRITTTTGGSLYSNTKYHSNTLTQFLAEKLNAAGHFIYAPTYADNERQREILLNNSQIKAALDLCRKANIVLTGIADTEMALRYLPKPIEECMHKTASEDLAGAINTLLITADGSPLAEPMGKLFIGLDYGELKRIGTVIALAGGEPKHKAIKAALLGGYISVLVTDQFTAEYLLL